MPRFSQESISKLSTCHADLQKLFFEVIKHVDCKIAEGHRNQSAQEEAFLSGKSKLNWPDSKHNTTPSLAADVYVYPIQMKNIKRFYWFVGYVLATAQQLKDQGKMTHSIRSGADWDRDNDLDDQTFNDIVHFELVL